MRDQPSAQATEERRTVSFTLPAPLVKAVALYEVESGAKSRSHAVEDLIERGLAVVRLEREAVPS
jgi:metal-responsive CopG/Arc/MetJ family transcriptional regulator